MTQTRTRTCESFRVGGFVRVKYDIEQSAKIVAVNIRDGEIVLDVALSLGGYGSKPGTIITVGANEIF